VRVIKVVIDTNVLVSSFFGGVPRQIIDLWKTGEVTLCLSQPIIEEYMAVLTRLNLDKEDINALMQLFAEGYYSLFTSQTPDLKIVTADPDDDKFLECAVALDCKMIVSGDKHLKDIGRYVDIDILSPRMFIDQFGSVSK
jgi:putative PIN family toxin of toxin-antitoxin system